MRRSKTSGFTIYVTFGTLAVDRGAPLAGVRDAMGHASLETTNRYAHGTEEGKRRAVEAQEKVIGIISGHKTVTKHQKAGQLPCLKFLILKCARHDSNVRPFAS